MAEPRVTVVMSAWNAAAFVPAAVEQLRAQTLRDYEVVVVDDASDDGTEDRLRAWAAADDRVTLLRNASRQGVAASRNRAVEHARGEYLWFTDCDDQWSPRILERLLEEAKREDADVVVCGAQSRRIDRPAELSPIAGAGGPPVAGAEDAVRRLLRGELRGHLWNKLFRRSLFDGVRFPRTRAFSDLGAMGLLLARAGTVALLDEPLYVYVLRPGSLLNSGEWRAADLLDCRSNVRRAIAALPPSRELADDLLRFEYALVYLPTVNAIIRRRAADPASEAVLREIRRSMTPAQIARLARLGETPAAVAAALVKLGLPVYAAAYRGFRRRKWGSAGEWFG